MAGRQDGIPIAEASARLGLSAEAVRKRLQRGTLHGYKNNDRGWFVLLDEPGEASGRQDTVRTDRQDAGRTPRPDGRTSPEEPIEAAYRVSPAEIEQAVSRTGAQYMGDLRTMLAEIGRIYEGQLAAKDETIAVQHAALETKDQASAVQAETVAELRRRAKAAAAAAAQAEARASEPIPYTDYWVARALVEALERQRETGIQRADLLAPASLRERGAQLRAQAEAQVAPPPTGWKGRIKRLFGN